MDYIAELGEDQREANDKLAAIEGRMKEMERTMKNLQEKTVEEQKQLEVRLLSTVRGGVQRLCALADKKFAALTLDFHLCVRTLSWLLKQQARRQRV